MLTREIAIHEAGHAVVAHALGIRGLALVPRVGGFACEMQVPEELGPLEHWTMAVVSLAGGAAEVHDGGQPDDGALEDLNLAVGHLAAWLGLDAVPPAGSGVIEWHLRTAGGLASMIVEARWTDVVALADLAVATDCNVPEADVMALLG
jgi:hypothetical protein